MTRKLKDLLNMSSDETDDDDNDVEDLSEDMPENRSKEEIMVEAGQIMNSLTNSEKVDTSLSMVNGLDEHDKEMDDIAAKALGSYKDLCDMGLNVSDAHAGRVYEVANMMLKTALDASNSKLNRKMKMIDLQIRKLRVDKIEDESGNDSNGKNGQEFDRNELLKHFANISKNDNNEDDSGK